MDVSLRDLQLCELDILKAVKRVCEENNLTYYLSSGTLLGAVRHQGFIPWDDDIDIEMPYPDYCKFIEIAQEQLGEDYFVQNNRTEDMFHALFTKVINVHTTMYGEFDVGLPGSHGVWIDVFPLIHVGGKWDLFCRRLCVRTSNFIMMDSKRFDRDREYLRGRSSKFAFAVVALLRKLPKKVKRALSSLLRKRVFRAKKGARMAHVWQNITYVHPAFVFKDPPQMLPFEDDVFSCPADSKEYLRNAYGDYMRLPPEDQRDGGHGKIIVDLEHSWKERLFE